MQHALEKLESAVERDMLLLRRFDHPAPSASRVDAIALAMQQDSRPLGLRSGALKIAALARWAMAAAVVLAIGLAWSGRSALKTDAALDAGESLAAWTEAVDESTSAVTQLFNPADKPSATESDALHGIDDFSDAFDSTFGTGA